MTGVRKDVIFVVTHKDSAMPKDSLLYKPIFVGDGEAPSGWLRDNTGENIAYKNGSYCELTAFYWIWKNYNCDVVGINHYRRFFSIGKEKQPSFEKILSKEEVDRIMMDNDIIVPCYKKIKIGNVRTQYSSHHYVKDLDVARDVISQRFPAYAESFSRVMKSRKMRDCNMMIAKKEIFDKYCEWLFAVLFEVEKKIDISSYSVTQKRVFGFLSERLFNVWLENQNIKVYELPIMSFKPEDWSLKSILEKTKRHILRKKL